MVKGYAEITEFRFKLNERILRSRLYAQYKSGLGGGVLRDFLLATNQRSQFRLRHNLGKVAGLAALIDNKNIVHDQHSYCIRCNMQT